MITGDLKTKIDAVERFLVGRDLEPAIVVAPCPPLAPHTVIVDGRSWNGTASLYLTCSVD